MPDPMTHFRLNADLIVLVYFAFIALWVAGIVLSAWMLIDCMRRDEGRFRGVFFQSGGHDRLAWVAIILFTFVWWVGGVVYFLFVRRGNPARERPDRATSQSWRQLAARRAFQPRDRLADTDDDEE